MYKDGYHPTDKENRKLKLLRLKKRGRKKDDPEDMSGKIYERSRLRKSE